MAAYYNEEGLWSPEVKPQMEEIRDATQVLYKQRLGEGYKEGGPSIADLTADQLAANQGLRGLVGSQDALRQEGINLTRGTTRQYTPSGKPIEEYMSPYLRTALDAQKQQAQRQYERSAVPEFEAAAVRAGGMSGLGSRAGVEAAERATGQNRLLSNIEAAGQQKAYEAAVAAQLEDQKQEQMMFKNQLARETDAATALGTSASDIYKGKASEYGLLSQMGGETQDLNERRMLDEERRRLEEYNFPETQLGRYQTSIYNNPVNKRVTARRAPPQGSGTSWGRMAGGLGAQLLGPSIQKGFGAAGSGIADWFSSLFAKGGQISSAPELYQYRANGGPVISEGIAANQFQNNFLERMSSPPMYNNTVEQPLRGLSSTMQAQPFMNINREGGGPVMPPVVYRQESGLVDPEKTIQRIELENLIKKGMTPTYQRGGDKTIPEKSPTLGEVLDSLPKYKAPESVGVINPTTGKIEMPPAKSRKKQATTTVPATIDSTEKEIAEMYPLAPNAALAEADIQAANTSGLAFKEQTLKNAIGTAKTQGPDAIETLRNAYKKYDATMKGTVETSDARIQAFWDQIGWAIAAGGDFKESLVKGFSNGQKVMAAMDKEEKAQTRASAGRELSTEEKVANILASRSKTRQEQLKELSKAMITASAAQKAAITKQMNAMKNKQYTAYLKKYYEKPSELKSYIKKVIDASSNPNKALQNKALDGVKEVNIVGDIGEIMIKQGKTQLEATKTYIKNLIGN